VAGRSGPEADFYAELPYPATRLTVTQRLYICLNTLAFGLYAVGTYYDKEDNKLWVKEVYLLHQDSRGIRVDEQAVDDGPSPPRFALSGKFSPPRI
jgi:hypothetical protein